MRPAFSTVAVPEWTLDQIAARAEAWGYMGVELRSFGYGSTRFACDPALTAPLKTRQMFDRAGVDVLCIATGVRFDEPMTMLDHIVGGTDASVRECQGAIDLASKMECPFARVFGFEIIGNQSRARAIRLIVGRLQQALDSCRNRGVRLLIENGGSFGTATDLAEILDAADHPLLAAAYSVPAAWAAGEDPARGVNVLGDRLASVKLGDFTGGRACALGEGDVPNRAAVEALGAIGYDGWLVFEHARAWVGGESDPERVLAAGARTLYTWRGAGAPNPRHHAGVAPR